MCLFLHGFFLLRYERRLYIESNTIMLSSIIVQFSCSATNQTPSSLVVELSSWLLDLFLSKISAAHSQKRLAPDQIPSGGSTLILSLKVSLPLQPNPPYRDIFFLLSLLLWSLSISWTKDPYQLLDFRIKRESGICDV